MRVNLLDGPRTIHQKLIITIWSFALLGVVFLWSFTAFETQTDNLASIVLSIGLLVGLLATFFALTQFMLMGRIAWIESAFGLDKLAAYHRLNGYAAIILILAHGPLIAMSYALRSGTDYISQSIELLTQYPFVGLAGIAVLLFVGVVGSSIYIVRKHLKFETWYFVHLAVYAAIVLASLHQFAIGSSLINSPMAYWFWLSLYVFVAFNVVVWRFGKVAYNFIKFDFRISRVVAETPTTTSVYIKARGLARLKYRPGQFVLVRIFTPKLWWQEHPFTVSWIPHGDELRLTIRKVGDYTTDIMDLKPGARLFVSGPFGRFTSEVAITPKRLFIAGGVGITPLRTLAEEAAANQTDAVLLYANREPADTPLKDELDEIAKSKFVNIFYIYSDAEKGSGLLTGRIDGIRIKELVPDFKQRDIYLCGPPPMTAAIITVLEKYGVPQRQIHYEQFELRA